MANVGYATLQVIPSMQGFSNKLRLGLSAPLGTEGAKAGDTAGRSFASAFAKVAVVGAAAAGVVSLGRGLYDAAIESQKVTKQTEAVLKSMGNVAGVTAEQVSELSEKLSLQSGIDDELIQSAQNVLLTFGKVRNEVGKGNDIFTRGQQAALDMSVALKQDLQGATIQVGKALNDPIKGITALSRAGVSFTEQQKEQITTLAKSGKTLEAQKIILAELETQFSGSAAAQATASDRLKVAFGNLQEELGARLVPIVERLAGWLADNLPGAMDVAQRFVDEKLVPALKTLWHWFEEKMLPALQKVAGFIKDEVMPRLGDIASWVAENEPTLQILAGTVGILVAGAFLAWAASAAAAAASTLLALAPFIAIAAIAAAVGAALYYAYENWGWFRKGVDTVVDGLQIMFRWLTDVEGIAQRVADVAGFFGFGPNTGIQKKVRQVQQQAAAPKGFLGRVSGARAMGGSVLANRTYWVGEDGPELFTAPGNGHIVANHNIGLAPLGAAHLGSGASDQLELSIAPGAENAAMAWLLQLVRVNRGFRDQLRAT